MNTFDNGWDYLPNQQEVCRVALDGKDVIEDTIIFSHSMGGLIFGGALVNGFCELGPTSRWYPVAPPTNGSRVADVASSICFLPFPSPSLLPLPMGEGTHNFWFFSRAFCIFVNSCFQKFVTIQSGAG
eukprot:TRINITY_DN4095_c0_g1_i5.p1 TRINITY_DN4095_c0_g1~~TRINITY_DN4095_c0_g1_i5.p1  ORF type:complete len:128 (+),score=15.38 TRINITY_DN4095_c0_g1_i5:515-898(+)